MISLVISSLRWRWAQARRRRRGDHSWRTVFVGHRSDFVECRHCPETGYRIKES